MALGQCLGLGHAARQVCVPQIQPAFTSRRHPGVYYPRNSVLARTALQDGLLTVLHRTAPGRSSHELDHAQATAHRTVNAHSNGKDMGRR